MKQNSYYSAEGARVPYIITGEGPVKVMLIPGAGDGLATVDRASGAVKRIYRYRRDECTTCVVSRRIPLVSEARGGPVPADEAFRIYAADFVSLLDELGWEKVVLECNSAGGSIGQTIAAEYPGRVRGLVLASTLHRNNPATEGVVRRWLEMIARGDWKDFLWDTMVKTYTRITWQYRLMKPFLGIMKPKNPDRIRALLDELMGLDNTGKLAAISCPTLITAGLEDEICPPEIQHEMDRLIPDSRLVLEPGYAHGNDVENPGYRRLFLDFVKSYNSPR